MGQSWFHSNFPLKLQGKTWQVVYLQFLISNSHNNSHNVPCNLKKLTNFNEIQFYSKLIRFDQHIKSNIEYYSTNIHKFQKKKKFWCRFALKFYQVDMKYMFYNSLPNIYFLKWFF